MWASTKQAWPGSSLRTALCTTYSFVNKHGSDVRVSCRIAWLTATFFALRLATASRFPFFRCRAINACPAKLLAGMHTASNKASIVRRKTFIAATASSPPRGPPGSLVTGRHHSQSQATVTAPGAWPRNLFLGISASHQYSLAI